MMKGMAGCVFAVAAVAAIAMISLSPNASALPDTFSDGTLNYVVIDSANYLVAVGDGTLSDGNGLADANVTAVIIPEDIARGPYVYKVTEIAHGAFRGTDIVSVDTGSVTKIDDYAFQNCTSLAHTEFGGPLISVGKYSFAGCTSLTVIQFRDAFLEVGERAFENCTSLTDVRFGMGVDRVGNYAFKGCIELVYMLVPSSRLPNFGTGSMELGTWYHHVTCRMDYILTDIWLPSSATGPYTTVPFFNASWVSLTVNVFPSDSGRVIGPGIYLLGERVQVLAAASEGYVFIGWSDGADETAIRDIDLPVSKEVTAVFGKVISDGTYYYTMLNDGTVALGTGSGDGNAVADPLKTVFAIPSSVTHEYVSYPVARIMNDAFYGCSYITGTPELPPSLTEIGDRAFYGCSGITGKVTLPPSLAKIGEQAFYGCSGVTSFDFTMSSVPAIGNWSFALGTESMRSSCVIFSDFGNGFLNHYRTGFTALLYNSDAAVHSVTVASGGNGKVSGSGLFFEGTVVTISAAADDGYKFKSWNDGNTDAVRQVTAMSDISYTAMFAEFDSLTASGGPASDPGGIYIAVSAAAVLLTILTAVAVSRYW